MAWSIAPFDAADAVEVGLVHVRVWQEAYAGLMPDAYLDSLDPAGFADHWSEQGRQPRAGVTTLVAKDEAGVVGLTTFGPGRDEDAPTPFELYAINVLARAQGSGLADLLMERAIGGTAAYLWVVEGNDRALAFYRRHGFADEGGRKPEPATGVTEIRMARGPVRLGR